MNDDDFSQHMVVSLIYQKLSNYWTIISESSQISSLLDPRVKSFAFESEAEKIDAKHLVLNLTEYCSMSSSISETVTGDDITETRNFFRRLRNNNIHSSENSTLSSRTLESQLERYLSIPLEDYVDPFTLVAGSTRRISNFMSDHAGLFVHPSYKRSIRTGLFNSWTDDFSIEK